MWLGHQNGQKVPQLYPSHQASKVAGGECLRSRQHWPVPFGCVVFLFRIKRTCSQMMAERTSSEKLAERACSELAERACSGKLAQTTPSLFQESQLDLNQSFLRRGLGTYALGIAALMDEAGQPWIALRAQPFAIAFQASRVLYPFLTPKRPVAPDIFSARYYEVGAGWVPGGCQGVSWSSCF